MALVRVPRRIFTLTRSHIPPRKRKRTKQPDKLTDLEHARLRLRLAHEDLEAAREKRPRSSVPLLHRVLRDARIDLERAMHEVELERELLADLEEEDPIDTLIADLRSLQPKDRQRVLAAVSPPALVVQR